MSADPSTRLQPLEGDPQRQAIPALRGYVYQIARTALAWLKLPADAIIIVEGAEDFDVITPTEGVAHQVKALTDNITLRSEDVREAIQNLWNLRRDNPNRKARIRFLTTAHPGVESGNPFGMPGLVFWNNLRLEPDLAVRDLQAAAMKAFLQSRTFSDNLAHFLEQASPREVFDMLIEPLQFDTALDATDEVENEIGRHLVLLGETFGVPPTESTKVIDSLFAEVLRIATSSTERVLDRDLLLRVFERDTMITVPRADILGREQLAAMIAALSAQRFGQGANILSLPGARTVLTAVPPLPRRHLLRPQLRDQIGEALARHGVALIQGPLRFGKTVAVAEFAAHDEQRWLWLDLSMQSGREAIKLMRFAAAEVSGLLSLGGVVVDGIPQAAAISSALGFALGELIEAVHAKQGAVIITSAQALSSTTVESARLPTQRPIVVAPFNADEIMRFLVSLGCNDDTATRWTKLLNVTTGGEPLLVHARAAALEERHFPEPTVEDMLDAPPEIVAARRDIRLTASEILSPQAYDLLGRLSLMSHSFNRDLALRLAAVTPELPAAGDLLDRLAGPWLEDLGFGRYRLYSIGSFLGTGANGEAWATHMHAEIGRAMLEPRKLTTVDAANILYHGVVAEDGRVLGTILRAMFLAGAEMWESFAHAASYLSGVWVGDASRPTKLSKEVLADFRLAQIRIALIIRGRISDSLWSAFEHDFDAGNKDQGVRLIRFLAISEILVHGHGTMSFRQGFTVLQEWADLATVFITQAMLKAANIALLVDNKDAFDPARMLGFTLLTNVDGPAALEGLLDALAEIDPDLQRSVFGILDNDRGLAHGFVQKVWLPYIRDDRTGSDESIAAMRRAHDVMDELGLETLADVFAEAVVRVVLDFGTGSADALKIADEYLARDASKPRLDLRLARANVLFDSGDVSTALTILRDVLPARAWDGHELTPLADYRRAAIAEIKADDWLAAARWLESAQSALSAEANLLWKMAAGFDAAYARWRGGDAIGALETLHHALGFLVTLAVDDADSVQFMVLKRIGHTVMIMCGRGASAGFEAPEVPLASNVNTDLPPGAPPLPATPIDAILEQAVRYEFTVSGDGRIARDFEDRVLASPLAIVRALAGWTSIFRAACSGTMRGVLGLIDATYKAMSEATHTIEADRAVDLQDDAVRMQHVFAICCIVPGLSGAINDEQVAAWRRESDELDRVREFEPAIDIIESLFVTGTIDLDAGVAGEHGNLLIQALAAVRYGNARQTSATQWLAFHGVWMNLLTIAPDRQLAGVLLEHIVQERWEKLLGQRFTLLAPAVTAPPLEAALREPGMPWQRVARILRAAEGATGKSLPAPVREELNRHAEQEAPQTP